MGAPIVGRVRGRAARAGVPVGSVPMDADDAARRGYGDDAGDRRRRGLDGV